MNNIHHQDVIYNYVMFVLFIFIIYKDVLDGTRSVA